MTKLPSSSMPAARGRLTSTVTPAAVPARIIGTRRRYSARTALRGFSNPTLKELAMSASAYSASAKPSGTRCVARGMLTSAAPNPVTPNTTEPQKAIAESQKDSAGNDQLLRRAGIHGAQPVDVSGKRQAKARLEIFRPLLQDIPFHPGRNAFEREDQDVRIVKSRHGQHRAAERALEPLQRGVELRIVVHEVHHQRPRIGQSEESAVVELLARKARHVQLVLEGVEHQHVAALRRERLRAIAD